MKKEVISIIICLVSLNLFAWTTPTLSSPANASIQWAGINLNWGAVASSENYEVQIDTTTNFNSPAFQNQIETYINSSSSNNDTQHFVDDLYFGKTYYWRVRSWITGDTSVWSTIRSIDLRDYVNLSSPADNSLQWAGLNLNWDSHSGVDFYEVQVDTVLTFNSSAFQAQLETYINSSNSNNDTQHFIDDLFFGETYYWRVRAINAVDTTEWSVVRSFDVRDYINLSSPADNSLQWAGLNLNWDSHSGVDFYELQVDTVVTFNSAAFQTQLETYLNSSNSNNDTQHFIDDLFFGETYYWRVRAINAVDTTEWSVIISFDVRNYVNLSSPADNSLQWAGLNLNWDSHSGVDFYEVQVDTVLTFNSSAFQTQLETYLNSSNSNTDTQHFIDDLFFGETYYWRVRAINAVDTTEWSVVRSFDVRDYINLSSPADNSLQWAGLNLNWDSHSGVDFYEVQVDTVLTFNSSAFQTQLETYLNSSNSNTDTQHFIDDLFFGETYYWRVRAINAVDTTEWSVVRSFDVRDYVNLYSPADFTVNVSTSGVNLNWDSHSSVDFYTLQWDTTNLFNSGLLQTMTETYINSSNTNTDTYHNTGVLLANQIYFWRVKAINAVDTTAWSSRVFSTGSTILEPQVPVLVSPSNTSSIGTTATNLIWNSSLNALEYEVQYSEDVSFVTNSSTITSATNENTTGLTNLSTYFWRVRGHTNGFYSDWSTVWSFNVDSVICTPTSNSISVSSCDSYTTPSGVILSSSTTYNDVIPNSAGCDSTIIINLTINNSTTGVDTHETCESYTWINGITYTSSNNTATHTLSNSSGCDSTITLSLIINNSVSAIDQQTACETYTWIDGNTYTSSNNSATHILSTSNGCDSIITLNLVIESIDPTVSISSNTLTANQAGAQYQWINCSDSSIIDGATDQSYIPTIPGSYAVIITTSNCMDTSDCAQSTIGIEENDFQNSIQIYPNPTEGSFSISVDGNYSEIKITNSIGQVIAETEHPSSSLVNSILDGETGLYFVHITIDNQTTILSIIKK